MPRENRKRSSDREQDAVPQTEQTGDEIGLDVTATEQLHRAIQEKIAAGRVRTIHSSQEFKEWLLDDED
ncbi:hypothetical protein [Levilactobacillus cerevisiae]|uniref:hypothetical protein n=1 Tax=Levilactobacillus cerevisiae TaxID=1704076 RepID=UPI000F77E1A2|nr:hypothetical protein [Levilactobacillus cerevisiae]